MIKNIGILFLLMASMNIHAQSITIPSIPHPLQWENKPLTYSIKGNSLTISAGEKTDMFRDPNVTYNTDNAPKLVFSADENFILIASIEHSFANKWDGGALVVKADSLHWIKFCFEKDYKGTKRVVSVVTKDVSDDCNSIEFKSNKVFFKIAKANNVFTLYCSETGKNWYLVRHLQFDMQPGFKVGFLAQSPTGKNNTVTFSNISYKAEKIKDPYEGE